MVRVHDRAALHLALADGHVERVDNELGICPSPSIAGEWNLFAGTPVTFRYRLAVFAAPARANQVDAQWRRFVEETS